MSDFGGLFQVLLAPCVTEKATLCMGSANQVIFKVALGSNKLQIKAAVEKMFGVEVLSVRTAHVNGKQKRLGKITGQRRDWKKAFVRLQAGQSIDFFENS